MFFSVERIEEKKTVTGNYLKQDMHAKMEMGKENACVFNWSQTPGKLSSDYLLQHRIKQTSTGCCKQPHM